MSSPRAEYERRLALWRARIAVFERRHFALSNARLAAAGAIALLSWLAFVRAALSPAWIVLGIIAFGILAPIGLGYFVVSEIRARRREKAAEQNRSATAPVTTEEKLADRYGKRR